MTRLRDTLPVPLELYSPTLLGTHAAIIRILRASGMAESLPRDAEEIKFLVSDGSTDVQILLPALLAC